MIRSFGNRGTEDVFNGEDTKAARRCCPKAVWPVAGRRLDWLDQAHDLRDLAAVPGARLELLEPKSAGWRSLRINSQYRIVFRWVEGGAEEVTIMDYHD